MNVWFPNKTPIVAKLIPALVPKPPMPIQADTTEHDNLVARVEKLATHNATHGKNVVFWSCKRCHPGIRCKFVHLQHPWKDGCTDPESDGECKAKK